MNLSGDNLLFLCHTFFLPGNNAETEGSYNIDEAKQSRLREYLPKYLKTSEHFDVMFNKHYISQ